MEIALVLTVGALCIGCFLVGAKVGQTVSKGEDIKLPTANPVEAYRQHEAKAENRKAQERIDTILRNMENYDGTSNGQEEIPR